MDWWCSWSEKNLFKTRNLLHCMRECARRILCRLDTSTYDWATGHWLHGVCKRTHDYIISTLFAFTASIELKATNFTFSIMFLIRCIYLWYNFAIDWNCCARMRKDIVFFFIHMHPVEHIWISNECPFETLASFFSSIISISFYVLSPWFQFLTIYSPLQFIYLCRCWPTNFTKWIADLWRSIYRNCVGIGISQGKSNIPVERQDIAIVAAVG